MNTVTPSLLTLLKLREGQLSPAAGVAVREQLATDSKLLRRWKRLAQIADQKLTLDDIFKNSEVDEELIAAYVEERLTPREQAAFESSCWQEETLIREVIAAYRAERFEKSMADISEKYAQHTTHAVKKMSESVQREMRQSEELYSFDRYLGAIEDYVKPVVSLPSGEPVRLEKSSGVVSHPRGRYQKFIYGGAAVLLFTVLPAYFMWIREDTEPREKTIADSPAQQQSPVIPVPLQTPQPDSDPELVVVPADQHRDRRPLIAPDVDNELQTPAVVAQKPERMQQPLVDSFAIHWSRLVGVAGIRNETRSNWQGILAAGQELNLKAESSIRIRTLPFSWLQAKYSSGKTVFTEMVLDVDTEIELMMENTGQRTADILQASVDLKLFSGRIAFTQLQAGSVLRYHTPSRDWLLEIEQDGTSIAFRQQEPGQSELMVYAGGLRLSDTISREELLLKPDQMLIVKGERISVPLKLSGNQRWRTSSAKAFPLDTAFVAELNHSEDLLAALMQNSPDRSRREQLSGVNLGIALDPREAVLQASSSPSELQRTAAIDWMLTTRDKSTLAAVWKQILLTAGANAVSPAVQTWFQVARGEVPAGQGLLGELSAGLEARQPLFVRQSSIHFLRQLTRLPLAEYDPDAPTPVAINSIRQKLRRLTGGNNRPGGNANRRQQ